MKKLIVILSLTVCSNILADDYTFGQWAIDEGLTGNETSVDAQFEKITDLLADEADRAGTGRKPDNQHRKRRL